MNTLQMGDEVIVMYQGLVKRAKIKRIFVENKLVYYNVEGCSNKRFTSGDFRQNSKWKYEYLNTLNKCNVCGEKEYDEVGEFNQELVECEICGELMCEAEMNGSCGEVLNEDQQTCKTCLDKMDKCDCNNCIASVDDCPEIRWFEVDGEERWEHVYDFYYDCPEYIKKEGKKDD